MNVLLKNKWKWIKKMEKKRILKRLQRDQILSSFQTSEYTIHSKIPQQRSLLSSDSRNM